MPTKTPKDIVLAAFHYLAEIVPPTQKISEVRIEEILSFKDVDELFWKVILSYDNIGEFPFDKKREYKEFKVKDENAMVISMQSVDGNK